MAPRKDKRFRTGLSSSRPSGVSQPPNTPPQSTPLSPIQPEPGRPRGPRPLIERVKFYAELTVATLTLLGSSWALAPSLDIRASTVINRSNPTEAEFTVSNIGRVSVYHVIFYCNIKTRQFANLTIGANARPSPLGGPAGQGIAVLHANESITRNCSSGFAEQIPLINATYPASFMITAEYSWPMIKYRDSISRFFGSRTSDDGTVTIAPDAGW
jgi:hypothetical protein